ncbi:MAG: phage tail protein, partial [Spirochaetota bacterium]
MSAKIEIEQLERLRKNNENLEWFNGTEWIQLNFPKREDIVPVGSIIPFAGSTAPNGWLLCDGSQISRTTYAELHMVLKDTGGTDTYKWGAGDGSTTFTLPDARSASPIGAGQSERNEFAYKTNKEIGTYHDDQTQGKRYNLRLTNGANIMQNANGSFTTGHPGSGILRIFQNNSVNADDLVAYGAISNGVHGNPRIGSETHGKQFVTNFIIKY